MKAAFINSGCFVPQTLAVTLGDSFFFSCNYIKGYKHPTVSHSPVDIFLTLKNEKLCHENVFDGLADRRHPVIVSHGQ